MRCTRIITKALVVCAWPVLSPSISAAQPPADADRGTDSAPAPTPKPVQITPPLALQPLDVDYPAEAEGAATVLVELLIDEQGRVSETEIVQGEGVFAEVTTQAARQWQFSPATRDGNALAARIRVEVHFTEPAPEPEVPEEPAVPNEPPPPGADGAGEPSEPSSPELALVSDPVSIVVLGERPADVKRLGRAEVRQMPGAFGDPYRAIEALPGVTPIASGLPYFFIRGAPPGNVGYFFDEVSVPLLYHAAAGPGVIHPAFIESVDLYAGAYPAKYGRFAGGIVEGQAADPDYDLRGELSLRLIDAGGFAEVPFADDRGSVMVGGRYSYTGLLVSLLAPDTTLGYWDYQARASYMLNPDDTLSLFAFGSHDFFEAQNNSGEMVQILDLTFHRVQGKYSHLIDSQSGIGVSLLGTFDRTGLGEGLDLNSNGLGARIFYENRVGPTLTARAGVDAMWTRSAINLDFDENEEQFDDDEFDDDDDTGSPEQQFERLQLPQPGFPDSVLQPLDDLREQDAQASARTQLFSRDDIASGFWMEAVWQVAPSVTLTPGFRFDVYHTDGDTLLAPEPRLTARFDVMRNVSMIHTVGVAHQPPSFPIPIPGATPSAGDGLQRAVQSSAGVEVVLPARFSGSATVFQNLTFNSTDALGTANLQYNDVSANLVEDRTTSHAYGLELYIRRSLSEAVGGFLSYTFARSQRSVARGTGLSTFDRTHVLNLALAIDLGRNWRLGTRLVTYSGIPAQVAYAEAARRPPRTPWYYRLDARLEKRWLIGTSGAWWALVAEMVNTTLNEEVVSTSCYAFGCSDQSIGPVSIPSLGIEASF